MKKQGSDSTSTAKEPRPYQKPVIRDFGSVATLTAGGAGSAADGGMTTMMSMA